MKRTAVIVGALITMAGFVGTVEHSAADQPPSNELTFSNDSGVQRTMTTAGSLDLNNPFFQELGTNGRTCFTCHQPDQGWTVTPDRIRARFEQSKGLDPIFRTNDGSNCEGADVSTLDKRRHAFTQLMTKGLIRIGLTVPDNAEFMIVDVDDPYNCGAPLTEASMYRRPLPSTNLGFLSTVMWDGRETVKGQAMHDDLATQAIDATTGHAQGATPQPSQVQAILDFEMGLFTAQTQDRHAGSLTADGGRAGLKALASEGFCIGVNDPLNLLPVMPGACATSSGGLNPNVFTLFDSWLKSDSPARRAIARGEQLFNTRSFVIDNVGGLNRDAGDPLTGPFSGTCTVCHDTPNVGDHSIAFPLDIGVAAASQRTPDLPLYTLQNKTTHQIVTTTDPGRAMVTGKWNDIGKFKGPILRGLAARAPYFHNGSMATLDELVDFYNTRFNIGLTPSERLDLIAFLKAL